MLTRLFNQRRVSGRGNLVAQFTGAGHGRAALFASLTGPFETRVIDGRFTGVDLWAEIERAIATAQGTAAPPRSASAYTPFDRFVARGRLDGTLIRNDRIEVENATMRAHGKGTVDYGTGALDLELTARLLDAPEGKVAGLSLDRIVGVDIPLTVRGSLSEPRVRPDVDRLLDAAARQKLREEGKQIEKKLKDKLDDALKDLIGQ
jgi:AsmA protein